MTSKVKRWKESLSKGPFFETKYYTKAAYADISGCLKFNQIIFGDEEAIKLARWILDNFEEETDVNNK